MILAAPQEGLKNFEAHRVIVDREDPHAHRELIPLPPQRHPLLLLHPRSRGPQKHRVGAGTKHPSSRMIFLRTGARNFRPQQRPRQET
jgi:hypothetical protein